MTKKKAQKAKKKKQSEVKPDPEVKEENRPFDFGGLPVRDLKKNLGCG